jgi:hypothetical protein
VEVLAADGDIPLLEQAIWPNSWMKTMMIIMMIDDNISYII